MYSSKSHGNMSDQLIATEAMCRKQERIVRPLTDASTTNLLSLSHLPVQCLHNQGILPWVEKAKLEVGGNDTSNTYKVLNMTDCDVSGARHQNR